MAPQEIDEVAKKLANVRLQVSALQEAAKDGSLPETLQQTRRTVLWSALLVAVALIASSTYKSCSDEREHAFEQRLSVFEHRLEILERGR